MALLVLLAVLIMTSSVISLPHPKSYANDGLSFVTREQWEGRPPNEVMALNLPAPMVIIHHTYIPAACFTFEECTESMRSMQDAHQLDNGWGDIGYNFAIGSDGIVYEGRGWKTVGAHAAGYNTRSIGITLIGDWRFELPPAVQIETTKKLIEEGIRQGYISEDYVLIGHRQVRATECPGQALFNEISTWDRFTTEI